MDKKTRGLLSLLLFGLAVWVSVLPAFIKDRSLERRAHNQYERLAELQRKAIYGSHHLAEMIPTQNGVGIEYRVVERQQDGGRWLAGVEVINVYQDSSAGRAGVLPGDWVTIIGEGVLCNALFARDDSLGHRSLAKMRLLSVATEFFNHAPDQYTLTVLRDGKELQFTLVRGPVAPKLGMYIVVNFPLFEERLKASRPLVNKLITGWVKDPHNQAELEQREQDLRAVEDAVQEPWRQVREFQRPLMVPPPDLEVVAFSVTQ